jgi:hypothetical protein
MRDKEGDPLSGEDSKEMLQEILSNQKEALDLNGQLVILNEKMDKLIDTMEKKVQPPSSIIAILSNPQALTSLVFLLLVALFLGLGDGLLNRMIGPGPMDNEQATNLIRILQETAASTTGGSIPQ